ncbi:YbdK family carboxylate-amine ligase [Streptomyces rectiverticillatus]|uniref:carboxylate-amine ligase n=1 Tax=Streptomyces rectiverticillatus TaxID=173860 RepID=UPI0015C364EE|nr:glutamate--cysteine ligase [Streptomyces rectiverticillatus]QLE76341.1 YbdK family carboxylate-amine ligase [Streptomyces rectiverticillatus]
MLSAHHPTVGVEEEYFLVEPVTRTLRPAVCAVRADVSPTLGDRVAAEIMLCQIEARTDPVTALDDLHEQIRCMRIELASAAARRGLRLMSAGTSVLGADAALSPNPESHYARSFATFRALDNEMITCACHVHIGVTGLAQALQISNRLRPWLPALIALTANSPYWEGRDTGYASWRTMAWARWPTAGPPPLFASVGHYEQLVGSLMEAGTVLDRSSVFWDVRPSSHVPTVEIRVADAASTAEDTLVLAAVVRALAVTALAAEEAGEPVAGPAPELLRAAYWRAARDGLSGSALDLSSGRLVPAADIIECMLAEIEPALTSLGDLDLVRTGWARLRARSGGAGQQRAAYRERGSLLDVIDQLIRFTSPTRPRARSAPHHLSASSGCEALQESPGSTSLSE